MARRSRTGIPADKKLSSIQLANGGYAGASDVEQLVNAMAGLNPPPLGQTVLETNVKQALAPTLACSWHGA